MIVVPIKTVSGCLFWCLVTLFLQGSSTEEIENISYTAKEINTVAGLHTYTVLCVCEPEAFVTIQTVWEGIFLFLDTFSLQKSLPADQVTLNITFCLSFVNLMVCTLFQVIHMSLTNVCQWLCWVFNLLMTLPGLISSCTRKVKTRRIFTVGTVQGCLNTYWNIFALLLELCQICRVIQKVLCSQHMHLLLILLSLSGMDSVVLSFVKEVSGVIHK